MWFFQGHTTGIVDLELQPRSKPNTYQALCPKMSCQKEKGEDREHRLFTKIWGYQDFTDFSKMLWESSVKYLILSK